MSVRLSAADRKKRMLKAALNLAHTRGYRRVTRKEIAETLLCSTSLVTYHFRTCSRLYTEIMKEAVLTEDLKVIAQGLIARDPAALAAPSKLKFRALRGVLR